MLNGVDTLKRFFRKKCPTCNEKVGSLPYEIKMNVVEGEYSVYVCDKCAEFWEDSAKVFERRDNGQKPL